MAGRLSVYWGLSQPSSVIDDCSIVLGLECEDHHGIDDTILSDVLFLDTESNVHRAVALYEEFRSQVWYVAARLRQSPLESIRGVPCIALWTSGCPCIVYLRSTGVSAIVHISTILHRFVKSVFTGSVVVRDLGILRYEFILFGYVSGFGWLCC